MHPARLLLCACAALASAQIPEVPGKPADAFALRYIDVTQGTGAPALDGKRLYVHYTGWLRDGTKFDSSYDRKEPIDFVQGRRQVIAGWDLGFDGMKVGGKRRLFIPYEMAYGQKGIGPIAPRADLTFDVELMDVKDAVELKAGDDLLLAFDDASKKVLDLANAVPQEKYSWRPGAGVRSFAEVFLHIANGNRLLLGIAEGTKSREELGKQVDENAASESKGQSKEEIVRVLAASFAEVRKTYEAARMGGLTRDVDYFGKTVTRRGIYTVMDAHIAEHLGQAIAYARMNGIVPPWSK